MNLYQKLVEIRKDVINFSKDTKSFGYKYVSGSQAIAKIRNKMDELGVILVPDVIDSSHSTYDYVNAKGKECTDHIVSGKMVYKWINAEKPEEILTVNWQLYGAQDDISKAFGSGLTYSERYFILKFFQAPTDEDDPDSRNTSNRTANYSNPNTQGISDKQINRLLAIARKSGFTADAVKKVATHDYGIQELNKLTKSQYDEICERLEKKGSN